MARRKHPTILEASVVNVVKRRGYPKTTKDGARFIIAVARESRVQIERWEKVMMNDAILDALGGK